MINCPVGTFRDSLNGMSVDDCAPCTPGWYCLEESETPTAQCNPGFYCPSPIDNPYGDAPAQIGSYGPEQVCNFMVLQINFYLCDVFK